MAGTGKAHLRDGDDVLLRVEDLVVEFPVGRTGLKVNAVSGISFDVLRGETLGLVGESGCGKSTTGRAIMQLPRPTSGSVAFEGTRAHDAVGDEHARGAHADADDLPGPDLVAQPAAQGPRHRDGAARRSGSAAPRRSAGDVVDRVLEEVGIDPQRAAESQAHQFSGGQCQRISIARSLVLDPTLIICDEPVSALDVSVQAQVLNLLEDLKARHGLTLIFIAHDLAVVKNISDRVAVMYLGKLCEVAPSDELYRAPAHPYTNVLLDSIPVPDPDVAVDRPSSRAASRRRRCSRRRGCRFHTRCPAAQDGAARGAAAARRSAPATSSPATSRSTAGAVTEPRHGGARTSRSDRLKPRGSPSPSCHHIRQRPSFAVTRTRTGSRNR